MKSKFRLDKSVKLFYIIFSSGFFISFFVLEHFKLQFRGYWTPKVIVWVWLASTLIFIIYFWKHKFAKVYTAVFGGLVVLSILPMAIPFFAILNAITTTDDYQRFTLSDDYRIKLTRQQALSMPRVYVYQVKNGIFEENPMRPVYRDIIEGVMGENALDNGISDRDIPLSNAKLVKFDTQGIYIDYTIQNQHKVIFHAFNNDDGY